MFSPAFIRTGLNKESIFRLVTEEILNLIIQETIKEFVEFVNEVII